MIKDFNSEEVISIIKEMNKAQEEFDIAMKEKNEAYGNKEAAEMNLQRIKNEKEKSLIMINTFSIFSKFISFFHRGKYYEAKKVLDELEININKATTIIEKTRKELESKIIKLKKAEAEREFLKGRTPTFELSKKGLVVTDRETGLPIKKDVTDHTTIETSKKVIVHCTDYFPLDRIIKSNFAGNKTYQKEVRYGGVTKKISVISHRHECHFTINNRVESTGAGEGNWDSPKFIIIDNYAGHEEELEHIAPSDSWTKGTSMNLSTDAVIMCRLDASDELPIPPEERDKYRIIYYEGDPSKCLKNFLRFNGYEICYTDCNDGSHDFSRRKTQEINEDARDRAIGYVLDENQVSKNDVSLTKEELANVVNVFIANKPRCVIQSCFQINKLIRRKRLNRNSKR